MPIDHRAAAIALVEHSAAMPIDGEQTDRAAMPIEGEHETASS